MVSMLILIAGTIALLAVIEERSGLLKDGDQAPEFAAVLHTGERFALRDFRSTRAVVLFFYPKDFSQGCTQQACAFRDNFSKIRDLGAVVVGISRDDSSTHHSFVERHNLPYSLLTDTDGTISRSYGVLRFGGLLPLTKRVTYVIDRLGVIRGVFHHELRIDRHVEDVIRILEELGTERTVEAGGEVAEEAGQRTTG